MNYLSSEDADRLRKLLNENQGLPIFFITRPEKQEASGEDYYRERGIISIETMEKGKILADDTFLEDGVAITTDEELRLMISGDISDEEYFEDPHGYMKWFAGEADKYKKMWRPALIVETDVDFDSDDEDEEEDW